MLTCEELFGHAWITEMIVGNEPGWFWMNPSIAYGDNQYRAIIRSSNFECHDGIYTANDPQGFVRTKNYLAELDYAHLHVTSMELIDDSTLDDEVLYPWVQNMEDARLFYDMKGWHTLGTLRQHRLDGTPNMAQDLIVDNVVTNRTIYLSETTEKNWSPWSQHHHIYSFNPSKTYELSSGSVMEHQWEYAGQKLDEQDITLRGSSQGIPWDDGYIFVTHEVTWEPHRNYWHRFVRVNMMGVLTHYTEPFCFIEQGIEFAAGLVKHKESFIVSFGHRDQRAMLARIPQSEVLARLGVQSG